MLKHPVEQTLKELTTLLKDFNYVLDQSAEEKLSRIRAYARFIRGTLRVVDPTCAPIAQLNNLNTNVQETLNELAAFVSNKNPQHITNAYNKLEAAVTTAQVLPSVGRRPTVEKLDEAISRFAARTDEIIEKANHDISKLDARIDELTESLSQLPDQIKALSETVVAQNSRVDAIVSDFQGQFSEAQESRVNIFQEFRDAKLADFSKEGLINSCFQSS